MRYSRIPSAARLVLFLIYSLLSGHAFADADEISQQFSRPSATELQQLRAELAQPLNSSLPHQQLFSEIVAREAAANKLGDIALKLALYADWVRVMPESVNYVNYAVTLEQNNQPDRALQVVEGGLQALAPGVGQELLRWRYADLLSAAGRNADAQQARTLVRAHILELRRQTLIPFLQRQLESLDATALCAQSADLMDHGQLAAGVTEAERAVRAASEGVRISLLLPRTPKNDSDLLIDAGNQANALQCLVRAAVAHSDYVKAEGALRAIMQIASQYRLNPIQLVNAYQVAGDLRFDLREFAVAETLYRKADAQAQSLGLPAAQSRRLNLARAVIAAQEGQRHWPAALATLDQLDTLASTHTDLVRRVQFPLLRGYAYLGARIKTPQALALFTQLDADLSARYPAQHFYVGQARGLRGVALWRMDTPAAQQQALPMLQSAVEVYMQPDNLVWETKGLGSGIRELVFATYLEAAFASPQGPAADAVAAADWVRGGLVQEALSDAASRSNSANPTLMAWVRSEQDDRNQIEALRKLLAGGADAAEGGTAVATLAPDVVTATRERINALDIARADLRAKIQAQFPDYDNLVRPRPPSSADIQHALAPDEALLVMLPTELSVYVWAITNDQPIAAVRVDLPHDALQKLVQDTRKTLDFAEMGAYLLPFNVAAASTLYQQLLQPVAGSLAGRKHLIVAAGGALGQLPMGVWVTAPPHSAAQRPHWLIEQMAITHIPSLSAWLAVKRMAGVRSGRETLAAWGDPQFNADVAGAAGAPPAAGAGEVAAVRHLTLTRTTRAASPSPGEPTEAIRYADIPALPETRDELLAIGDILHADPAHDIHLGALATKASVLSESQSGALAQKNVLVFATHGLMAGDLPDLDQPALALAATGQENTQPLGALLTLNEVLDLKLNADWVILSACNTAAADGKGDEALSGLARGFFYAGSRSLLVTHWSVESASAQKLTTQTIAYYIAHPSARKAESLRQAMLQLMQNPRYQHPAYWAPYALVGDGGR